MFSNNFRATALLLAVAVGQTAHAQDYRQAPTHHHPQLVSHATPGPAAPGTAHYPQLQAPMYPSPVQYTPPWNGGTIVTNQAFAPHEMLYPHSYHAMYGPFYYNVKGSWIWTPFGVRQHEQVKLEGTEVIVKYKSQYPLFSGFKPPR